MNVYIGSVLVLIRIYFHVSAPCMSHFGVTYGLGVRHAGQDYMQFTALEPIVQYTDVLHPSNHDGMMSVQRRRSMTIC